MIRSETLIELKFIIVIIVVIIIIVIIIIIIISSSSTQFELFELILLLRLYKGLPVEQFEAAVSQSTVPFPLLKLCSRSERVPRAKRTAAQGSGAWQRRGRQRRRGGPERNPDDVPLHVYIYIYTHMYM